MSDEYYDQRTQPQRSAPRHAQGYQRQQYQQQYQQQQYQQPQYQASPRAYVPTVDITSTGQWVLTLFLVCIPVIGFILMLVWAFGSNTAPSKKNWARANLIWLIIGILVSIIVFVVATVMGFPISDYINQYYSRFM